MQRLGGLYDYLYKTYPPPKDIGCSAADSSVSVMKLIHMVVCLYHIGMTRRFKAAAVASHNHVQVIRQLETIGEGLPNVCSATFISLIVYKGQAPLLSARQALKDDVYELTRLVVFNRCALFNKVSM